LSLSVAEQVTVVVPRGNVAPEALEHVGMIGPSLLSTAVAAPKVTTAPAGPVASAVLLGGTVTTGEAGSCTVTVKEPEAELLLASVAVQFTGVEPNGNVDPDVGEQLTVGEGSAMSVAVTEKETASGAVDDLVIVPGRTRVGFFVSLTTTVTSFGALVLLLASFAVQLTVVEPIGKMPEDGAQVTTGAGSTESEAVVESETVAPEGLVASVGGGLVTVTMGAVVSTTTMLTVPVTVFGGVSPSVTVQLAGVVPSGYGDSGRQVAVRPGPGGSVAMTVTGVVVPVASVVTEPGSTGGAALTPLAK
jgi:hypothetical protein